MKRPTVIIVGCPSPVAPLKAPAVHPRALPYSTDSSSRLRRTVSAELPSLLMLRTSRNFGASRSNTHRHTLDIRDASSSMLRAPHVRSDTALAGGATSSCTKTYAMRFSAAFYTTVVLGSYGLSLFVNSITASLLSDTSAEGRLFLLSAGRAAMLFVIVPILVVMGHRPTINLEAKSWVACAWSTAVPAYVACIGNTAYLAYFALVAGGQVGVLAPMVGLYSVIPVTVGLIWRGEARTWQKLTGIALCFAAVLTLGVGSGSLSAPGGGPGDTAMKVLYLIICWVAWGSNDTLSSAVEPARPNRMHSTLVPVHLDIVTVAMSSLFGQLICCGIFGFASFVESTNRIAAGDAIIGGTSTRLAFGWPHAAVVGANALAIIGWLSFVRLGQIGETSAFVPVCALYTYVPVLLSCAVLGETMEPTAIAGLLLAAVAVLLISMSSGTKSKVTPPGHSTSWPTRATDNV